MGGGWTSSHRKDQRVPKNTKLIQQVRNRLRVMQIRQKSYADRYRSDLKFQVGDFVLLKVSLWKDFIRLRKRGKLGSQFIGPFWISDRVGKVAYQLDLADELSQMHNTFHVCQLRKCVADETAIIFLDGIQVDRSLNYVEMPIPVLDKKN